MQTTKPPSLMREQRVFESDTSFGECGGQSRVVMSESTPTVAWRTISVAGRGVMMLHERAQLGEIQLSSGGYGSSVGCAPGIVQTSLTLGSSTWSRDLAGAALAVDLAASADGTTLAVASPGAWTNGGQVSVFTLVPNTTEASSAPISPGADTAPSLKEPGLSDCFFPDQILPSMDGQVTALTFVSGTLLAVQEREPAGLVFVDISTGTITSRLDLAQSARFDTGHTLFHVTQGAGIACASCHPEAGDDGHVWTFDGIGPRRTQYLRGGILGTEPLHWNGDMQDFSTLMSEVFAVRMGGFNPTVEQAAAVARWVDEQPLWHATPTDALAVERGRALFESEAVGCATCHSGAQLTNNETVDVGTGARLQVPALRGVSYRLPIMHDGCAETLLARFGSCGGGDRHGRTSSLTPADLADMTAYLETL
jgi:hypothetical protein